MVAVDRGPWSLFSSIRRGDWSAALLALVRPVSWHLLHAVSTARIDGRIRPGVAEVLARDWRRPHHRLLSGWRRGYHVLDRDPGVAAQRGRSGNGRRRISLPGRCDIPAGDARGHTVRETARTLGMGEAWRTPQSYLFPEAGRATTAEALVVAHSIGLLTHPARLRVRRCTA